MHPEKSNFTTLFDSAKAMSSGFVPTYMLKEGLARTLEFVHPREDALVVWEGGS